MDALSMRLSAPRIGDAGVGGNHVTCVGDGAVEGE